jgi:beta-exotoxin I transport system permease protein
LQNFFTIFGFYAYFLAFVVLAGAVQAMNLGVGILSKEETDKTADFLLTKPIGRGAVVTSKLLAASSVLCLTNALYMLASLLAAKATTHDGFDTTTFLLLTATLLLVQIAFLALGLLLSVVLRRVKSVSAVSLPTVFAFYVIGTLGAIVGNHNVKYITPFKFFDTAYIASHGAYEVRFLLLEAVLVVLAITASYVIFIRKDIRATA